MHCFWASGLLVQQQAYLYDTCNLNLQTIKRKMFAVLFFFYTEYLLCAMFTESLKLCIWLFFLQHWWQSYGFEKEKLCFFPAFLTLTPKDTRLPATPFPVACKSRVKCFTFIWEEKSSSPNRVYICNKQHHINTYTQCSWSRSNSREAEESGRSKTIWDWNMQCTKWTKSFFLKNKTKTQKKKTKTFLLRHTFLACCFRETYSEQPCECCRVRLCLWWKSTAALS